MKGTSITNFICLAALSLLGNSLIIMRFTGNAANDILGLISAVFASAATALIIKLVCQTHFKDYIKRKTIVLGGGLILTALLLAAVIIFTVYNFSQFASNIMLNTQNIFFPFVSVSAVAVFLGLSGKKVLYKLSAIILPLTFIIIILMFAYSVRFMDNKYFIPYKKADGGFLDAFLPFYLNFTFSSVPLLIIGKSEKKRIFTYSFIILFVVIGIGFITTLGVFGSELASTLRYPYLSAVSTAAMGEIFSRFDGFLYFISFFSVLIKTGLCVFLLKEIFLKIFKLYY